ncbi:hypothetical protein KFU94_43430 [Chloroflexi bacterium TSY]|nr:hypothetical protein [Chloroflexi bacterium TSY]
MLRAVVTTLRLLVWLLTPLLLVIATGIARQIITAIEQRQGQSLTTMQLYLVCIGSGMGLGLLAIPVVWLQRAPLIGSCLVFMSLGCIVGLMVAPRIAQAHVSQLHGLPQHDPAALHGIDERMSAGSEQRPQNVTWEDVITGGVVLGRRVRGRDP